MLPGTLPVPELARRLADTDAAVIMKLGRTFAGVREALRQAGRLDDAVYVERASTGRERRSAGRRRRPGDGARTSRSIVVPGRDRRADAADGRCAAPAPTTRARVDGPHAAELLVVGLGPGPDRWLTPEVTAALAAVDHVVGYGPYVDRVPQRPGLQRHASGNTVEVDRARLALDLAPRGERVAVVSGGDAGRVRDGRRGVRGRGRRRRGTPTCRSRCCPGVTAAQAVAARAGAPLGADYAVLSLSDRLKPWAVDRATAARGRRGRPGARALQPGLAQPHDAGGARRGRCCSSTARPTTPVVVGRDVGPAGRAAGGDHAGRARPGGRGHAVPADHRRVRDVGDRRSGLDATFAALRTSLSRHLPLQSGPRSHPSPGRSTVTEE